jgi:serine/threonine protein kinase/WD40 repeat protein/Tfp pilus assembly protein PilF
MTSSSEQIEQIFWNALQLTSEEERKAYLESACGANDELRRLVEQLLRAQPRAAAFLEQPLAGALPTVDEPPVPERPGTVIGPYKLLEQIGEGGFGVVFMAEQTRPVRRKVALKALKPGMDTRQVVARFEAERQALALMDHPNIARVFDGGESASGRPYFVMELVRGVPITDFCDDNHLPVRQRLELFVSVCQAVQHAHQKGIIHRDLKPSNVMVTLHDGTPVVKVIDFGIAKALGQQLTDKTLFTNFAQLMGTPTYMSPEQVQLSGLDMDTRTDIYSLGVLLYELLTSTTPCEKKRLRTAAYDEIRRIIREEEPARPSLRVNTLGQDSTPMSANRKSDPARLSQLFRGELDWIVMKALEKDRDRRYETVSAFAADVHRYLSDEQVLACPPSAGYRLRKFVRRYKGPLLAASIVMLALLSGIVGTTLGLIRATDAEAVAVNEAGLKEVALATARQSEREKTEQLWRALVAQALANRLSRRAGQRFESLAILQEATQLARTLELPAENFHELRNAVIATLGLPDLHLGPPWNNFPSDTYAVDFDVAHAIYARTDWQGNCSIRRVADDAEDYYLPGPGVATRPCLSRDGKFVAVGIIGIHVWHLDGRAPRRLLFEEKARIAEFTQDSKKIVLAYTDGTIRSFELPSGRQSSVLAADPLLTEEIGIALHPAEPVVAVWSYHAAAVQLRELRTGKVLASLRQPARPTGVAWHPNGRTLAVGYGESSLIRLFDRNTLQSYRTLDGADWGAAVVFNHAGDRLAASGWKGRRQLFDVGTGQKLFETLPIMGTSRFGKDDQRLAGGLQEGKLGIWQVGDGREFRLLLHKAEGEQAQYTSVSVSPDGRLLSASTMNGFGVWDLSRGSELAFIETERETNNRVLFEPSGNILALGPTGLWRWPIPKELRASGQMVMGPPVRLPLPRGVCLDQSRDGRVIVTCSRAAGAEYASAGGWILRADHPSVPIPLDAGADIGSIAVSPDGLWVVTATQAAGLAKVWDARDGRLVKQLHEWGAWPRFSPDGRWVTGSVDGGRLIEVGSWAPGPRILAQVFAPDGKLIANETTTGIVHLLDLATGRELATLEDPNVDWASGRAFTPDGTKLIGYGNGKGKGVHIWDLRLVREHLTRMRLDWDAPPYPPADPGGEVAEILKLEVRPGNASGSSLTPEQKARQAIEEGRAAVKANPDNASACNDLAWAYLVAPQPLREVTAALPLAEKAVRLAPKDAMYRNTLGLAYFRAGRYQQSVKVLRPNLAGQDDRGLAFDLYVLALSYQRLGETTRARDYYDWAVRWARAQRSLPAAHVEELKLFRAEAEAQLGIAQEK